MNITQHIKNIADDVALKAPLASPSFTEGVTVTGGMHVAGSFSLEGTTEDAFEVTFISEPTSDISVTIPNRTFTIAGTDEISGLPAFSAYLSTASVTVTSGVATKVQFNTEEYDTISSYDNVTNFRFTAPSDGKYSVKTMVRVAGSTTLTAGIISLYKNGAFYCYLNNLSFSAIGGAMILSGSRDINLVATDYLEIYATATGTGTMSIQGAIANNFFTVHKILGV